MQRSSSTTWIVGTVLVSLLLAVAAWFLLISPTLSTAGETRTQAEQVEMTNEQTVVRIARLKEQFAQLDTYKAELAALRTQVPETAQLSPYLRQLDEVAQAHSVTITSIVPSPPATFAPVAAAATEEVMAGAGTTEEAAEGSTTDTATAEATAAAAATAAPAGMADIAVALTVVGSYDNVLAFIDAIQQTDRRLFLATTVTGTAQDDQAAGGGRPETRVGDLEAAISGYVFLLPSSLPADQVATEGEAAPALPGASAGKNPLVPVG